METNKHIDMVKMSTKMLAKRMAEKTIEKLKAVKTVDKIDIVKIEILDENILWVQFLLFDGDVLPIKIDLLKNIFSISTKNIYLSPPNALNIEADFITPKDKNLAIFLAAKKYLVIGISPREDNAPVDFNFELIKDWGFEKRFQDFKEILDIFQAVNNIDFDVLGHSDGGLVALNYASNSPNNKLKAVRVMDKVARYPPDSQEFQNSQISLNAVNQLINSGIIVDREFLGFVFLAEQAMTNPTGDSGVPRPVGGDFTNAGLFYFSLINTNVLPGLLTPITGLPSFWYLKKGFAAGTYQFGTTPSEDTFSLTHINVQTIFDALSTIGSGTYALALDRDFYAIETNQFPLNIEKINVPVYWINAELGFGDVSYSISLLKTQVFFEVVKNYGIADPVFSTTADVDFWGKLVP